MQLMLNENLILGLVGMGLLSIFGLTALKMWYNLHREAELMTKVRGLQTELGKIKTKLRQSQENITQVTESAAITADDLGIANIQDMTLEQVAESLGFDATELNNPLVRPMAEKVFARLKAGMAENAGQDNTGF